MKLPFNRRLALLTALAFSSSMVQAGVVVVMSSKSDVSTLSKAQVSQIFLAKTDALPNGRVAKPVDQADGSAVRNEFYDKVADKNAAQMKAYWSQLTFTGKAQPPRKVSGDAAVKAALAENPAAVGYISDAAVDGSVKVVFKP
ncbi:phosphate ABC transporter substrate-binding protein [Thermomonas brevis]|uniref:Phosphate ABC transporter substrate-binding protein n=1 Tax=Thermomonas brevis TaxID=215691 RepID=A0A7G9QS37_9GAMM|nr:phosphate ABC transporter substrate-binding protein [Thermomonas brevis]QNN46162.1 phosphate ABC transporter substrate-binding protein [Thermomonas brevis]